MEKIDTMTPPPPRPWMTRAAIREFIDQARPHKTDPSVNSVTAKIITYLRPNRSPNFP